MSRDTNMQLDDESNVIIYEGASIRQLSIMFGMDKTTVQKRIAGLAPCGRSRGTSIYNIKQAAQRLVEPSYEIERHIMNMNHLDLPPLLAKEFWNGQRSRLSFETENGDLWRTADVVRTLSLVFLTYRMVAQTLPDVLEREAGLGREQKAVVRRVVDGALEDARDKMERAFEDYNVGGDVGAVEFDAQSRYWAEDADGGGTEVLDPEEDQDPNNGL